MKINLDQVTMSGEELQRITNRIAELEVKIKQQEAYQENLVHNFNEVLYGFFPYF